MTKPDPDLPSHDRLADADDELGWDVDQHGRMWDHAAPSGAVRTVAYDPDADPFLTGDVARDDREPKTCPRCGQVCTYDGWDHVHPNGIGIGSCNLSGEREG